MWCTLADAGLRQLQSLSPENQQQCAADCVQHVLPYYEQVFPKDHRIRDAIAEARRLGDRPTREHAMLAVLNERIAELSVAPRELLDAVMHQWESAGGVTTGDFSDLPQRRAAALAFATFEKRVEIAHISAANSVVYAASALMSGYRPRALSFSRAAVRNVSGIAAIDDLPEYLTLTGKDHQGALISECIEKARQTGHDAELNWQLQRIALYSK